MNYFLQEKGSSFDYVEAKNLFRRTKLRDDLQNNFTLFDKYEIIEGMRPDNVALELYESDQFDWVVLLVAGITNVRNEWPLSNRDLYNYVEGKYGLDLNSPHHYETVEVKDSNGRLILPEGKIVDSDFTIPNPNSPLTNLNPVISISNIEYETRENTKKSSIYLLRPSYLQQFLNDMRNIMIYQNSSEYVSDRLIRTENTRVSSR